MVMAPLEMACAGTGDYMRYEALPGGGFRYSETSSGYEVVFDRADVVRYQSAVYERAMKFDPGSAEDHMAERILFWLNELRRAE